MRPLVRSILIAALALGGCANRPQVIVGNNGAYPTQHAALFAAYLQNTLRDPASAQVRHVAGPAAYATSGGLLTSAVSGWAACYAVNAKNGFGGYAGTRGYMAVFRDGRIIDVQVTGTTIYQDADILSFCGAAQK